MFGVGIHIQPPVLPQHRHGEEVPHRELSVDLCLSVRQSIHALPVWLVRSLACIPYHAVCKEVFWWIPQVLILR